MKPSRTTQVPLDMPSNSLPFDQDNDLRKMLHRMLPAISQQYRAHFDASDIVQQTLIDAFSQSDQYRGKSEQELAGWLNTILKHNLLDAVRRLRSRKRDIARERLQHAANGSVSTLVADQTSPSKRFAKSEELERVKLAIQALPDAQRTAVTLHHLEGQTLREIAQRMECSRGAVAGLVHRGLRRLQKQLGQAQ